MLSTADVSIQDVLRYFTRKGVEVGLLVPTPTGMGKSIMDATANVRDFLKKSRIHDYESQPQGEEHKRFVAVRIVTRDGVFETRASMYRPPTKQGDPRIWIYGLKQFAKAGNVLALISLGDEGLLVVNASSAGLVPGVSPPLGEKLRIGEARNIDLDALLEPLLRASNLVAMELLGKIRALAGIWHPGLPGAKRDNEVGRLLEHLLGIKSNSSKAPDYRGIELKSSRKKARTRQSLFARVPDWSVSQLKSSAEILDAFGYQRSSKYQRELRCTVSSKGANSQGLYLSVEEPTSRLLEASNKPGLEKVVYWPLEGLKDALLSKHPETFWVAASSRKTLVCEEFKYEHVLHTRRPMSAALPTLLEAGIITVDHMITRDMVGKVSEQGPAFKISRKDMELLFPPGEFYTL